MHSSQVDSITRFDGKRILCIGATISGGDIASAVTRRGKAEKVVNSFRRSPYAFDRFSHTKHVPCACVMFNRMAHYGTRYMPPSMGETAFKGDLQTHWPNQLKVPDNFLRNERIFQAGVVYAPDFIDFVNSGKITVKPEVKSCNGTKTITFVDGTTEDFDVVITGTGFSADLSILPDKVVEQVGFVNPFLKQQTPIVYKHVLAADWDNLGFVGLQNQFGPVFPTFELQARYLAQVFAKKLPMPTRAARKAWIDAHKDSKKEKHNAYENFCVIAENIAEDLGVAPSYVELFWNPPTMLFKFPYSAFYRRNDQDPEVAKDARTRFEFLVANEDLLKDPTI